MKTIKTMKRSILILACACMLVLLNGCSGSSFDADQYVKGIMDNVYLGDSSLYQTYVEVSESDALKEYETGIRSESEMLLEAYDIDDASEETYKKFDEFYKEVYKKAKYEVKDSEIDGDGFKVEVTIQPIDIIIKSVDEMDAAYEEFFKTTKEEDFANSSAESDAIAEKLLEILNKHKESLNYGEAQSVTVTVSQDRDQLWEISDDDFVKLDHNIIAYE